LQAIEHGIEEDLRCLPGYQPFATLGEYRIMAARIREC
jgi:hypothetical protein